MAHSANNFFFGLNKETGAAPSVDLLTGLVSVWEFDETSGTTATDAHGTFDGTSSNATVNQAGILDKCYLYNGTTSIVDMGNNLGFDENQEFTYSVWFKRASTSVNFQTLISKTETSGNYRGQWFSIRESDSATLPNRLSLTIRSQNINGYRIIVDGETQLTGTGWYHVIATYDGSGSRNGVTMYVNGVAESVTPLETDLTGTTLNAKPFQVGVRDSSTFFFTGNIDQTAVWSKVLTQPEVTSLYNSGSGLAYSSW